MSVRIDLHIPVPPSQSVPLTFLGMCLAVLFFTWASAGCALVGWDLWNAPQSSFFTRHAHAATEEIVGFLIHPALAPNYLENQRALPVNLRLDFQKSGVMHLLALSGAQIGVSVVIAAQTAAFFAAGTASLLGVSITGRRRAGRVARRVAEGLTALCICAVFGWGGSLLRAASLRHLGLPGGLHVHALCRRYPLSNGFAAAARVGIPLLLVSFCFGNAWEAPGFLLSLLGSFLLAASARAIALLTGVRWEAFFLIPAVTSLAMTFLLLPLFPTDPAVAVVANMLAIPLVDACIAPLSLLLLAAPAHSELRRLLSIPLDAGFGAFEAIAGALARAAPFTTNTGATRWVESEIFYLQVLTAMGWVCDACLRQHDV